MEEQDPGQVKRLAELLTKLNREFRDDFKRSNGVPCDLTLAQYQVLTFITEKGVQSQKQIAFDLGVTGPTVVRIVDALEHKELVRRTRDLDDRRVVLVSLTEKGMAAQYDCSVLHQESIATMIERLPAPSVDVFLVQLATLLKIS